MRTPILLLVILFVLSSCNKEEAGCPTQDITFTPADPFCSLSNSSCQATVNASFRLTEECPPENIGLQIFLDLNRDGTTDTLLDNSRVLSGDFPDYSIQGEFPVGDHAFIVEVTNCGCNDATKEIPFSVADCKAPAPICINGLAIELMPLPPGTDADGDGDIDKGAMTVFASDFIASPITDCSSPIVYSINLAGETPDSSRQFIIFTCDNDATSIIEIYAWDSAFNPLAVQPDGAMGGPNYDFCETYVLVQDNNVQCD